jgi:hypothetical protein
VKTTLSFCVLKGYNIYITSECVYIWTKLKDWTKAFWNSHFKFYQVLQYTGLAVLYNVMARHGVTAGVWDFWIASFAILVYGVFCMWEGREDEHNDPRSED